MTSLRNHTPGPTAMSRPKKDRPSTLTPPPTRASTPEGLRRAADRNLEGAAALVTRANALTREAARLETMKKPRSNAR